MVKKGTRGIINCFKM